MTSKYVTFDDFLSSEPATAINVKREKKVVKAPAIFKSEDWRDTVANWTSPTPEEIVLFWSETKCQNCKKVYSHPTYEQNSLLIKYRVSKFRAILRPYSPATANITVNLPRVKCVTESVVHWCISCFESKKEYTDIEWELYLKDNSPPSPFQFSDRPEKPKADVDYTDFELKDLV